VEPEPVSAVPPRPVRPAALVLDWRDVTFLHWPLEPEVAARLLPPGTRPDLLGDRTFVGVVWLEIARGRLPGTSPVPWLGTFGQVNVRLYSVDDRGRRGVVFLALHADRLVPALAGRALGRLPYGWSRVRVERSGDRRRYTVGRPGEGPSGRLAVRVGPAHEPDPVESFVVARWGVHHRIAGRTVFGAVEHDRWRLRTAELLDLDVGLLAAAGLPGVVGAPVSVLFSPGFEGVRLGAPAREPPGSRRRPRP
jgi:uncharacterized protein YqjF (DUF2071 family)